jgi:uncharacterized protein YndB with AHSA1/START domain
MKWVWIVAGALGALVVVVALIGAALPREHRATSTVVLRQPPDSVWRVMRDFAGATAWWPGLTLSERLSDVAGHERWHQKGGGFEMTVEIAEDAPPARMTTLIISRPGDPFGGKWIYVVGPAQGGARVTITEDGWVSNVIFRFMSRFVMGHYTTIDTYLTALGQKFGEAVRPEHVS